MNVGILGNNLTSLILAKALANKKLNVTLFYKSKINLPKSNRCIGITSKNLEFIEKNICKIEKKFFKSINEILIYSEINRNEEAIKFKKKGSSLLNIIKIHNLLSILTSKLRRNKFFKQKKILKKNFYESIIKDKKYDLIFNCEKNNKLTKKYFYQNYKKDYKSEAITFNLYHSKIHNNKAVQIFTKFGPLAFLPISSYETSVVFSMYIQDKNFTEKEITDLIKFYNKSYKINKISKIEKAKLLFSSARKYHSGKILLFGDILHQIHPLAGQGFNMTLRDLKTLLDIIQKKMNLGLNLDRTVNEEFEKQIKHYNFIYSNGINFIQDFFKLDSKYQNKFSSKIFNLINKNKFFNNFFTKIADEGININ
tara:strand:- start:60 stop:1160 length:1101 start_codon:yes stop_codon:yes gene_type:complete